MPIMMLPELCIQAFLKIAAHVQAKLPVAYNMPSWKGRDVLALQAKAKAKFPVGYRLSNARSGLGRVRQ
jgi:hypothetical protein